MGVSVSARNRARAIRARYAAPGFNFDNFGVVPPKGDRVPTPPEFDEDENNKLHQTARANAEDARRVEKLTERKRWSNG